MCSKKYTNMFFLYLFVMLFGLDHSKSPLDDLNCYIYLFIVNSHNHQVTSSLHVMGG